jgi:hypothetical protein
MAVRCQDQIHHLRAVGYELPSVTRAGGGFDPGTVPPSAAQVVDLILAPYRQRQLVTNGAQVVASIPAPGRQRRRTPLAHFF